FSDIANWANGFTSGIGAAPWSTNAINSSGSIPDGVKITASTAAFSVGNSSGVQKGSSGANPPGTLVFVATGASDNTNSVAVDLNLDFSGTNAGVLSFDWQEVNNSTGDRASSLRIYTSPNGTTWTELVGAAVLNVANNVAASGSVSPVALPSSLNGSAT